MLVTQADELLSTLQDIKEYLRIIAKALIFSSISMVGISSGDPERYRKLLLELAEEEIS